MSQIRRLNLIAAAVLALVSGYVFVETASYPGSVVPEAPGPAFFPRLLAGILLVLSAVMALQAWRSDRKDDEPAAEWTGLGKIAVVVGLTVFYLFFLEYGDFFLMTPFLLASVMAVMGERRIGTLVTVPLLFNVFVYLVFVRLFGLGLPTLLL